jgi:hypothetical protein
MPSSPFARPCKIVILILGLLLVGALSGERTTAGDPVCIASLEQLRCFSLEELDQLFCHADGNRFPVGFARGCILLTEARHPKMRMRVAAATWEGKCFAEDGSFINQWRGFQALHSQAVCGTSWCDGKACVVLEYPPGTPLFANIHEEVRAVGPGLWLVRAYERCPCPKFLEYIGLELQPCCGGKDH